MTLDGTSMAAPHVAGVMAIILGENSRYRNVAKGTDYLKSILSVNRLSELNHSPNKLLFTSVKHLVEKGHPDVAPRICSVLECYMQRKECDDCAVLDAHVNALSQSNYIYGSSPEEQNVKMYSESHLKSDDAMDVSEY